MHIKDLQHAEEVLRLYVPNVKAFTGKGITLERMAPLMQRLGNPELKVKVIHIAGTSGKTSTSYYCGALLRQAGKKVGVTVSPHIDKVTERIQLNGKPISDKLFCDYLGECLDAIKGLAVLPSYFELLMALAYWIFEKEAVDYAVIETGMGGLLDGSNVATRTDKVCIITDIGFDHMHILGNTIAEIAAQKAGIIHAGNVAYMYHQQHDVMKAVRNRIEAVGADYIIVPEDTQQAVVSMTMPDFQKRNVGLACAAVDYVLKRDGSPVLTEVMIQQAAATYVPARMDMRAIGAKKLIMDGAHNGQKMEVFVHSFQSLFPDKKAVVLLALKEGKEYEDVLTHLQPMTSQLIVTTFDTSQDLPSKSCDPHVLASYAKQYGFDSVEVIKDNADAYEALIAKGHELCVITGSFYLIGQIRKIQSLEHRY